MRLMIFNELNMKKGIKLSFMFKNKGVLEDPSTSSPTFYVQTPERYGSATGHNMYCEYKTGYTDKFQDCTGAVDEIWTYKGSFETTVTQEVRMINLDLPINALQRYYSNGDKQGTKLLMKGDDTIVDYAEGKRKQTSILYGHDGSDYFRGLSKKFIGGKGNDSFELHASDGLWQKDVIVNGGEGRDTYILNFHKEYELDIKGAMRIKDFEQGVEKLFVVQDYDPRKGNKYKNLRLIEKNGNTKLQYKNKKLVSTLAVFEGVTGLDMTIKNNRPIGDVGLSGWHADHVAGLDSQATIF